MVSKRSFQINVVIFFINGMVLVGFTSFYPPYMIMYNLLTTNCLNCLSELGLTEF